MRRSYLPFLILFFAGSLPPLCAQTSQQGDTTYVLPPDSLLADSSRFPLSPIPNLGSLSSQAQYSVPESIFPWIEYRSSTDILEWLPGILVQGLGSPGQQQNLSVQGNPGPSVIFLEDGVVLNDPLTGIYNNHRTPLGGIEEIEVGLGTNSFFYGVNAAGGAVNFVSKNWKALKPISRIRYSESAGGYGLVDGMVSQDIIRGLNAAVGFQHQTFDGQFPNSGYDAWTWRFKTRYNISNTLNVYASEIYNTTETHFNYGIDLSTPDSLRFSNLEARVNNAEAYEKIDRHDLQAGIAFRPISDTNSISSFSVFLTTQLREYRDDESQLPSNGILARDDHRTQRLGAKLRHERRISDISLQLGTEIREDAVIASPKTGQHRDVLSSVFTSMRVPIASDIFMLSPSARFDHRQSAGNYVGLGGDVSFHPFQKISLFAGVSRSYRFASYQELFWVDSLITGMQGDKDPERHVAIDGGIRAGDSSGLEVNLTAFHRTIHNAIVIGQQAESSIPAPLKFLRSASDISRKGFHGRMTFRWKSFFSETSFGYLNTPETGFPRWNLLGGIYFWDSLFSEHLILKTGFRGRYFSSFEGKVFDPESQLFLKQLTTPSITINAAGVLDFVLIGHLGDAYVHLLWENLLGRKYITTVFYPMPGRQIRFGVTWQFFD